MTLEELGQILRAEREGRQLSIEDVAKNLRVSAKVLRAIEAGDKQSLPHIVYVRGFVLSYGKLLGLDTQELVTATCLYEEDETYSTAHMSSRIPMRQEKSKKMFFVVLLLFLCIGAGALVFAYTTMDFFTEKPSDLLDSAQPAPALSSSLPVKETVKKEQETQKNATAVKNASEEQRAPEKTKEVASSAAQQKKEAAAEQEKKQVAAEQEKIQAAAAQEKMRNENAQRAAEAKQQEVIHEEIEQKEVEQPFVGPHKVIITAVAECWIHSTADNTDTRQFSLKRGDTFALTFDAELVLKLGNAGGVRIHYNGKELPVPGKDGQVKTIRFPST